LILPPGRCGSKKFDLATQWWIENAVRSSDLGVVLGDDPRSNATAKLADLTLLRPAIMALVELTASGSFFARNSRIKPW
jgi:hypothetical protein